MLIIAHGDILPSSNKMKQHHKNPRNMLDGGDETTYSGSYNGGDTILMMIVLWS